MAVLPVGVTPFVPPTLASGPSVGTAGASPHAFAEGLKQVEQLQQTADATATGLATGSITDVHQFTTAASKASLGIDLTVALRNRAVEAYQEIMRMQV
nr:flagellar hook-basal body complex protein FliE [uncultured Friedmanniella sp.]